MTVWKRGDMYFEHREEKVYQSQKDETPSMFFARIIKDLERKGANIWGYLKDEMKEVSR